MKNFIKNMESMLNTNIEIVEKAVKGCSVKIISNYNGHLLVKSRPILKGQIRIIKFGYFSNGKFTYFIEGELCGLSINDIEFID